MALMKPEGAMMKAATLSQSGVAHRFLRSPGASWMLLAGCVLLGFVGSVFVSGLHYPAPDMLWISIAVIATPFIVMLVTRAWKTGVQKAKVLKADWTWWHPLWFLMF